MDVGGPLDLHYLDLLLDISSLGNTSIGHDYDLNFWRSFSRVLSIQVQVSITAQSCIDWGLHHHKIYKSHLDRPNVNLVHPKLEPPLYRFILEFIFGPDSIFVPKFPEAGAWKREVTENLDMELNKILTEMRTQGHIDMIDMDIITDILKTPKKLVLALSFIGENLDHVRLQLANELVAGRLLGFI